jgi:hypothetical protein
LLDGRASGSGRPFGVKPNGAPLEPKLLCGRLKGF